MTIMIELNGNAYQVADGQTISGLVATMQLTGKAVAVAVNREVVSGSQWPDRRLLAADRVDIVRAIGGG